MWQNAEGQVRGMPANNAQAAAFETQSNQGRAKASHAPIDSGGRSMTQEDTQGHYNYYGVPLNYRAMSTFRYEVSRLWFKTLRRRSQKSRLNWARMSRLEKRWLPIPKIRNPYPEQRLRVFT